MDDPAQLDPELTALVARASGPDAANARAALDAAFWKAAQPILTRAANQPLAAGFQLAGGEADLLDFGLVNQGSPDRAARFGLWREAAAAADGPLLLTGVMARSWKDCVRQDALQGLETRLEALRRDLAEWPELHLALIRHRDQLVLDALGDSPQAQHCLHLYSEIDERLEQYKRLERLSRLGFRANDERRAWQAIRAHVEDRLSQIDPLLAPLIQRARAVQGALQETDMEISGRHADLRAGQRDSQRAQEAVLAARSRGVDADTLASLQRDLAAALFQVERTQGRMAEAHARAEALRAENLAALAALQLASAVEAVFESVGRLQELHESRRELEQKFADEQAAAGQATPALLRAALQAELAGARGLLRLCARYARQPECPIDLGDGPVLQSEELQRGLAHLRHFDPRLFRNPHALRHGPPRVLVLTGVGLGVFDREHNRLVVPLRGAQGAEAALANAAALYRLDVDAAENDHALLKSFRADVPENRALRSNLKLRNRLVEQYLAWISHEAHGRPVLSRETRLWFEARIAPPREEPWVPAEYQDLGQRQLAGRLTELEGAPAGAEREFRCALLYWLLYPDNARALRDWVLPRLDHALELAPDNHGYLYSAAVLHRRAGSFQRAIELFTRFERQAPTSWWTRKAAELCALCR